MISLSIKAFAKINLGINVLERLNNGYHLVDMVMHAIELSDEINVVLFDSQELDISLEVVNQGDSQIVPVDDSNLAFKAAKIFSQKTDKNFGVKIRITKNIPVAAGLAGGSSDGAAVILALNKLLGTKLKLEEMANIGSELGTDLAFCVYANAIGNPVLADGLNLEEKGKATFCMRALGIGDELLPLGEVEGEVLLVKPPFGISTKEAYEGFDKIPKEEIAFIDMEKLCEAIKIGNLEEAWKYAENALENYAFRKYKKIVELKSKLLESGEANLVLMSGSGPTIFAIYDSDKKRNFDFQELQNEEVLLLKTRLSRKRSKE